jgi:hypothetical protein
MKGLMIDVHERLANPLDPDHIREQDQEPP